MIHFLVEFRIRVFDRLIKSDESSAGVCCYKIPKNCTDVDGTVIFQMAS